MKWIKFLVWAMHHVPIKSIQVAAAYAIIRRTGWYTQ